MDNNEVQSRLDNLDNYLKKTDVSNLDEEIKKIINNYIRLDYAYQLKHEELKNIYQEYKKLYKTCQNKNDNTGINIYINKLENINKELKFNDENMFNKRIKIVRDIRNNNNIKEEEKNILANRMFIAYKKPNIEDFKPLEKIQPLNPSEISNSCSKPVDVTNISRHELDKAYIQKHNELMQMYRAYKILYDKSLRCKENIDEYKGINVNSGISKDEFDKMLDDQKFIMKSLDDMQNNLVEKQIIRTEEKIPTTPVIDNIRNMELFNDTMKEQLTNIINKDEKISEEAKQQFEKIIESNNEEDTNNLYREMILLRK